MKKLFARLLLLLTCFNFIALPFFVNPTPARAADSCYGNETLRISTNNTNFPQDEKFVPGENYNASFTLNMPSSTVAGTYTVRAWYDNAAGFDREYGSTQTFTLTSGQTTSPSITFPTDWYNNPDRLLQDRYLNLKFPSGYECTILYFSVIGSSDFSSCKAEIYTTVNGNKCNNCFQPNLEYTLEIKDAKGADGDPFSGQIQVSDNVKFGNSPWSINNGTSTMPYTFDDGYVGKSVVIYVQSFITGTTICSVTIPRINPACDYVNQCSEIDQGNNAAVVNPFKLCEQINDQTQKTKCEDCAKNGGTPENPGGIWTAIGCINRNPENVIAALIIVGLGMGGGVSLLMIMGAAFMLTTSQGEPKRVSDAKEMVTAAIIGLIFVIFSVSILQFIGVTVLRVPGFGGV